MKMSKEEAQKKIQELTAQSYAALREAEKVADEYGLAFNFSVEYGMGGTYYGEGDGWMSSSSEC